ncbi:G-type lectin S-receptor-like serine/threonine-protein kinase At2g19130 [Oryza brachyantha]|uniref:Receptor-like serine/threonine-protein kinase n=1 Tax=Oryza brachyantha TaxID=4533 RepID=J3N1W7_ORYBR|nr:G-type lectin S-receptor-like serine/threonine-protein kinase At2g19130 [Oryza brachyantha]
MSLLLGFLLLLLMLSLHYSPTSSAATDTVSPGHALAGMSDRLVSNNGKFALGFFKTVSDNSSSYTSRNSYLCIWYNKLPMVTPLWSANGESPVVDPASPELTISGDGNMVILDHVTKSIVWSTGVNATTNDTIAVLLNDGNLVLQSSSNSSMVFWQSFDYPTDSLFIGGKIYRNKVTGLNRRLVSRKNTIDQTPGLYSLEFDISGVGHLVWNSTVIYWSTGDWDGKFFSLAPEMIGATIPNFTFVNNDKEVYLTYTITKETAITRAGIDVNGRGIIGVWYDNLQNWLINYRMPILHCDVYAVCGPFTVCNDDNNPFCECMKGFSIKSPKDWDIEDRTGGCMRNSPLNCDFTMNKTGLADRFYHMQSITLPHNGMNVQTVASQDECSEVCLRNCSCTAYSYGKSGCSVWHYDLYNVRQQSDGVADGNWKSLHIRVAANEMQTTERKRKSGAIIGVGTGAGIGALILMIILIVFWRRRQKWFACGVEINAQEGIGVTAFRYIDLQRATKNFSERLGGGSFGSVFKGCLNDSIIIAVKRLDGTRQGEKQFRAEVNSIGIIQHINLVKLIGFCCEDDKKLLVYEYMPNRSLDVHLFKDNAKVLDWNVRYQIAIGVARGLAYLHSSCRDCIIHCDIKPENILLDASFVPKIADFGMAKVLGREFSHALTTVRGTIGYLAPEWISGTVVTSKVDVYSYGMVLFEIISGRRNSSEVHFEDGGYSAYFPMQVARQLIDGAIRNLVDAKLHGDVNLEEVERICKIACWCIQDSEVDRPTMCEVVQFFEGILELKIPPLPRLLNNITGGSHPTSLLSIDLQ